jgi:hypothetical protein
LARNLVVAALIVFVLTNTAKAQYGGPIIDAHSQFGCEISASKIRQAIYSGGVAHTLLSARGCHGEDALESHRRALKLVQSLQDRASFLISTKLVGMGKTGAEFGKRGLSELTRANKKFSDQSVGFAEILVQHAPHDTNQLRYDGISLDLKSDRIVGAIDLAIDRQVPVILHLELDDYEKHAAKILDQLHRLLSQNPGRDFVLIHLAQATPSEAENLIEKHENIHFMTTSADAFTSIAVVQTRRGKRKSQVGWANLFSDPPKAAPYKGWLADYLPTMRWDDDWKRLIETHPERFVFAIENVFGQHWTKRYLPNLKLWRKAFSLLPRDAARMVACANAKRLWKLEVACGV